MLQFFIRAAREWNSDKAPQLAAATAYYTVFSLTPLLLILLGLAGLFIDPATAQRLLMGRLSQWLGAQGAQAVSQMLASVHQSSHSLLMTVIGFVLLLLGATGLLLSLQGALNQIWHVEPKKGENSVWILVIKRAFSLLLLLGIGALLLGSLVLTAAVSFVVQSASTFLPDAHILVPTLNTSISLLIVFLLFCLLFAFLPDVRAGWGDVWRAALLTAILFVLGTWILGLYLRYASVTSAYGPAGSLIALLLWINYSAQIFFFGAECAKVYAQEHRLQIEPSRHAEFIGEATPKKSWLPDIAAIAGVLIVELRVFRAYRHLKKWFWRRRTA